MAGYETLTAAEVWERKNKGLIGRKVCRTLGHGSIPEQYSFMFRTLVAVEAGPHAYTLVYSDGTDDTLITYDRVWVKSD